MIKKIIVIIGLSAFTLLSATEVISRDKVIDKNHIFYKKGSNKPFSGIIEKLYNYTDIKEYRAEIKDGKIDGKFIVWHLNGKKKVEEHYKNGKLDGKSIKWYKNGQKKIEAWYKNDKKIKEIKWDNSGEKLFEREY